jgi:hypothetical protein
MRKRTIVMGVMISVIMIPSILFAIETAPRISDREIVERLTRLEEGQKSLERRIDNLDKGLNNRIDDLRSEMNNRFEAVDKRFDTLQWMLGLFITIALVILGFVLRMQWQMQKRQTSMETSLETYKDELAFIKGLIDKLLPPKGVL